MSNFMPVNAAAAQSLNDRLSQTIFKSAADFVNFYNSGLINKKNDQVVKIAEEVTTLFKDVKEKGGELVFLSQQEVLLNEILVALTPWEILVKAKREITDLIAAGTVTDGDIIAFSKKNSGYILSVDAEGDLVKIGSEKLFSKFEEISAIFEKGLLNGELDGDTYSLYAQELAELDDSFITKIHEVLPA